MSRFYFVRHGETEWNAAGRLCGRADVPLSTIGEEQARLLAERLKPIQFEALYSSPLRRAVETAAIVGGAITLGTRIDPRLIELSYGAWEGKTQEQSRILTPEIFERWERDPEVVSPPSGESGEQLIERVKPFLAELPEKHPTGNVLVVCHRTLCRLIVCYFKGIPLAEYRQRVPMDNAALNIFEWSAGHWSVLAVNDTAHLAPMPGMESTRYLA
jgi:broad specificity phosphatase PhoE